MGSSDRGRLAARDGGGGRADADPQPTRGKRNAIDPELRDALAGAIERAGHRRGRPRRRADRERAARSARAATSARFDELHDARAYRHVAHRLTDLVESIERLEKPVVAAIDGVVTGAGLALALACDWRVGVAVARACCSARAGSGSSRRTAA